MDDVGMAAAEPWVWVTYYHPDRSDTREGLLAAAGHIVGQSTPRLLDFTSRHEWEPRLQGYRFEVFGRRMIGITEKPRPMWMLADLTPPDLDILDVFGMIRVEVWRWRAIHDSTAVFAQVDWRPQWDHKAYSFGGVIPGKANDTARANEGLAILQHEALGIRPVGSTDIETTDEYARTIYSQIYDVPERARHVKDVPTATIAGWLGISESSIDRYKPRFGIGIRDIRRRRVPRPN